MPQHTDGLPNLQQNKFIGVLNVAAHGDAHRDPRDLHSSALQLLGKISSRSFALNRWIRRNDDFVNSARVDASNEVRDAQLLRSDSVQGRDASGENRET